MDLAAFDNPAQGGNVVLEGNIEARASLFPEGGKLLFLNLENVLGAMFVDFGNLWNDLSEIRGNSIHDRRRDRLAVCDVRRSAEVRPRFSCV